MESQTPHIPQGENKMGVMPVNRLILNMSLPVMISMLIQALYNVVDSVFVSMISENALTAVSLAFPVQNLMIAIGAGTGVGINALLSRSLGEKNLPRARAAAHNGVFLAALSFVVFVVLGATLSGPFYASQVHVSATTTAADAAEIVAYGTQYLTICCCLAFGPFFSITFERLLQSTGRTVYTMAVQSLGAIMNLILDPIMIFGLLGFPRLGVAGAALATVAGQLCGALLALWLCRYKNPEVPLRFRGFRPSREVIRAIYAVGVPGIVMQSIASVMTYGMNQILIAFSTTATAVFGIYFKLNSFIFMPVFGLNSGLVPILAYNYGARKKERILRALKVGVGYAVCIMTAGMLAFQLLPEQLLDIFQASDAMLAMGVPALRIISTSFIPAAFCIVCNAMFQALGNGMYSMLASVSRQLVVLLPAAYLLSLTGKLELVWLAFPIAEVASLLVTVLCLRRILRRKVAPLSAPSAA